jgi:Icc-related predicted phosphoesterase
LTLCFFVSDLHGNSSKYNKLFEAIGAEKPGVVFVGGDFLPSGYGRGIESLSDFVYDFLSPNLQSLKRNMLRDFPRIFLIMGNDDERKTEPAVSHLEREGLLEYMHEKLAHLGEYQVYGYSCVPPTPFQLKDWERYDISKFLEAGCLAPEDGWFSVKVDDREIRMATIKSDLHRLVGEASLQHSILLFHAPPYSTHLDRASLDDVRVDGVQLDVHVGSVAIRRLIESRQPMITLHGHIHESARLSKSWQDKIGRTYLFTAAHDGPQLALVSFDLENPAGAVRKLI